MIRLRVVMILFAFVIPAMPVRATRMVAMPAAPAKSPVPGYSILGPDGESATVVNERRHVTLTVVDRAGNAVIPDTWTSESPDTATVSPAGVVAGVRFGISTITARVGDETAAGTVVVTRVTSDAGGARGGDTRPDAAGNVYLSDPRRHVIVRVSGSRDSLFAGSLRKPGFRDGVGRVARFNQPTGLGIDNRATGGVYIADSDNHCVRKVDFRRRTTVVAGPHAEAPNAGPGRMEADVTPLAEARFTRPQAVAAMGENLFVADTGNHAVYYVDFAHARVVLVAGAPGAAGLRSGVGRAARFSSPTGLAINATGDLLAVADTGNNRVRLVRLAYDASGLVRGEVVEIVGQMAGHLRRTQEAGMVFNAPASVAFDDVGSVLVVDSSDAWVILRPQGHTAAPVRLRLAGAGSFASPRSVALSGARTLVLDEGARRTERIRIVEIGPPEIAQTTPASAPAVGGVEVVVRGANFGPETRVTLGDAEVEALRIVTATELRFRTPALLAHGARTLTVRTRGGVAQRVFHATPPSLDEIADESITTLAGATTGYLGDGGAATSPAAVVAGAGSLALDALGAIYWPEAGHYVVRRADALRQRINVVAGTGRSAASADGLLATATSLTNPVAVAIDGGGSLYIADANRVRRVDAVTGLVSTWAGTGVDGSDGDGGLATQARISATAIGFDSQGNLYILDGQYARLRRVTAATGIIETAAILGDPADGAFESMAVSSDGDVFVARVSASRVWRYSPTTGGVTVWAGQDLPGFSGDGGPAHLSELSDSIAGLAVGPDGSLYIADAGNGRIRRVAADAGHNITTVAGGGEGGLREDGVLAQSACIAPLGIVVDGAGALMFVDVFSGSAQISGGEKIRRIDPLTGRLTTVAGTGRGRPSGDGDLATSAAVDAVSVTTDARATIHFVDASQNTIRRVDPQTSVVERVAGTGRTGFTGDGGQALDADFASLASIARGPDNAFYVADTDNGRIRRIDVEADVVATVAGGGPETSTGDGFPPLEARLGRVGHVALDAAGTLYFSDSAFDANGAGTVRIRRVPADRRAVDTVAGFGAPGDSATIDLSTGVAALAVDGESLYVARFQSYDIVRIDLATLTFTRVAGTGAAGPGDSFVEGGRSLDIVLDATALVLRPSGDLLFADAFTRRILRLDATTGRLWTVAGGGTSDSDGIPARAAQHIDATALTITSRGDLLVAGGPVRVIRGAGRDSESQLGTPWRAHATGHSELTPPLMVPTRSVPRNNGRLFAPSGNLATRGGVSRLMRFVDVHGTSTPH